MARNSYGVRLADGLCECNINSYDHAPNCCMGVPISTYIRTIDGNAPITLRLCFDCVLAGEDEEKN